MKNPERRSPRASILVLLAGMLLVGTRANAQDAATDNAVTNAPEMKPLWEVGVFGGAARLPHYSGSDEYNVYVLPLPFLIYRGEVVQADRDGLRGIFYKSERVETTISMSGNPPVDGDNDARDGMPELLPLVEAGPAIKYFFYRNPASSSFYLHAAVRGVVAASIENGNTYYEGLHSGLSLVLAHYRPVPDVPWSFGLATGVDFTDARYNGFFYDVSEEQVRPDRGYFQSDGGYAGLSTSVNAARRLTPTLLCGLYARWDSTDGAVYEDSPLVRETDNYIVGAALVWTFEKSKQYVRTQE